TAPRKLAAIGPSLTLIRPSARSGEGAAVSVAPGRQVATRLRSPNRVKTFSGGKATVKASSRFLSGVKSGIGNAAPSFGCSGAAGTTGRAAPLDVDGAPLPEPTGPSSRRPAPGTGAMPRARRASITERIART